MPSRSATCAATVAAAAGVLVAACAGGPAPYRPGALTNEQLKKCRAAEVAYREGLPDYPALRDAVAADPVAAAWLVRLFVLDVFAAREGRPLGEDQELLRAAARLPDPLEARAVAEIRHLGILAVPTLVGDLLRHDQPQPRELGIELLGHIGAPAVPALRQVAESGEPRHQRAAARALGAIGVDAAALEVLSRLCRDGDYTVRADALRGLASGGPAARDLLLERLQQDGDPFVRRVAAQSLGGFRETAVASALVDYLERCKREKDFPGEQAAQGALQRHAGSRGPRTPAAWRTFVQGLSASWSPTNQGGS